MRTALRCATHRLRLQSTTCSSPTPQYHVIIASEDTWDGEVHITPWDWVGPTVSYPAAPRGTSSSNQSNSKERGSHPYLQVCFDGCFWCSFTKTCTEMKDSEEMGIVCGTLLAGVLMLTLLLTCFAPCVAKRSKFIGISLSIHHYSPLTTHHSLLTTYTTHTTHAHHYSPCTTFLIFTASHYNVLSTSNPSLPINIIIHLSLMSI